MIRLIISLFLLVMAGNSSAANSYAYKYYPSSASALSACQSFATSKSATCSLNTGSTGIGSTYLNPIVSAHQVLWCVSPNCTYSQFVFGSGYKPCTITGQIRDTTGICSCPNNQIVVGSSCGCPVGQSLQNGVCVVDPVCPPPQEMVNDVCRDPCPLGQVRAFNVPALNTTSTACVNPEDKPCSALGVDVNAFVAKCSELIPGKPSSCRNNDMGQFSIAGCPSLKCSDGSTVIYPDKCPPKPCPAGFTLSELGNGYGQVCTKNLPDPPPPTDPTPDNPNDPLPPPEPPCMVVDGSSQPLCAEPDPCQQVNGEFVCFKDKTDNPPPNPDDLGLCRTINGKLYCLDNKPNITVDKKVVTNPDGSVVVTTTTTTDVQGDEPDIEVEVTYPNGEKVIKKQSMNRPGFLGGSNL